MAYEVPTSETIEQRVRSDIKSAFGSSNPWLRRAVEWVLARVLTRAVRALYDYVSWAHEQSVPTTAAEDALGQWASAFGVPRKEPAYATGNVTFTGTATTTIPAGTKVVRSDDVEFTTDEEADIGGGGSVDIAVTASEAGADSNTEEGDTLTLASPIADVDDDATVASGGITGGLDIEDLELWRARILGRIEDSPMGGSATDLEAWALEVSGVTRAWVRALDRGAGTVDVYFVRDGDGDGSAILPDAGEVTAVQDYLNTLRPVTMDLLVVAPTAHTMTMSISIAPNSATTQAAVEAEIEDLLLSDAEPDDGSGSGTILLSKLQAAVANAAGITDSEITAIDGGGPADVEPAAGKMVVLGAITWSTKS